MARSCVIQLCHRVLLAYLFAVSVLPKPVATDVSCRGCCSCGPCGKNNRNSSLFPHPEKTSFSDGCSALPPNCQSVSLQSLEGDSQCIPDCKLFANSSACQGYVYPGRPTIRQVYWQSADTIDGKIRGGGRLTILWYCPADYPQNTVGFRIRLIDAETNEVVEAFDYRMDSLLVKQSGSDRPYFSITLHTFDYGSRSSCCDIYIPSRALTQNYMGRYIKSDEEWRVKVQILSLPINGSMGLSSPQSDVREADKAIDGCRAQKCPIGQEGNLTCSSDRFQAVYCLCHPLPPTNVMVTAPGNHSHWSVYCEFEDKELFYASQLRLFFQIRINTSNGDTRYHEVGDVCSLNLSIPAKPGVTIWAEVSAIVMRTVNGVQRNFSSRWSTSGNSSIPVSFSPTFSPVSSSSSPSSSGAPDTGWLVAVIVLPLVVAILGLVAILVYQQNQKTTKIRAGYPKYLLAEKHVVKRIVETVHDTEALLAPLIENHVLSFLSPGYKRVMNADANQQVFELIEVIRQDANTRYKAFGFFLYAIRKVGYENLYWFLLGKTDAGVIDDIKIFTDPPPPEPLLPPTASVYISYSRLKKKHEDVHHLCTMLAASSVHVVLDDYYCVEMADNEPQWIAEQFSNVKFVIVILDDYYPLNLPRETTIDFVNYVDDDKMRRTQVECQLLQGDMYRGRTNFVIPVQFGNHGSFREVPALLRSATCYHLPHKFLMNNQQFQMLSERVLGPQQHAAVQCHYEGSNTFSRSIQVAN